MLDGKTIHYRRLANFMKRLLLLVIFSAGIALPLFSKKIAGTIQNVNFKTIDIAKILLKETGQYFYSMKNGKFEIPVPDQYDSVSLVFTNNFYYTKTVKVKLDREFKKIDVLLVPMEYLKEEVTVTALSYEEKTITVPMAESVVSEVEIKEKIAENLVETLQHSPGIHFIGAGGFSVTPSIRGLARRRVLLLVDGTRLISDRRAGTSGGFVAPELIKRIEVVRSSSSVIYGSDAIGGVVQLFTGPQPGQPDDFGKNSLDLNYSYLNEKFSGGFTLAKKIGAVNIYTGFQLAGAGNYSSPGQEIVNSGYTNYCGIFNLAYQTEKRDLIVGYLGGYGKNVGKPGRDNNPNKLTTVPQDINHTVNLQYRDKSLIENGAVGLQFYFNPTKYTLEKVDIVKGSLDFSDTRSQNFGLKLSLTKNPSTVFSYQLGVDQYSRMNVDILNQARSNAAGPVSTSIPLENGKRSDTGLYFTFDYTGLRGFDFFGGARYTFFSLTAKMQGTPEKIETGAPSAFFGVTRKIGKLLSLFVNVGRAFRTPSLSEAFYTGITGRQYVIANPDLKSEKSFNIDSGLKFFSNRIFLGGYLFSYRVDDMIERYLLHDAIYTHDNIMQGRIDGAEIEFQFFPLENLEMFGHYFYYVGKSKGDDVPLNDIPAPRILLGSKLLLEKFWCELNYIYSSKKSDPGPAEIVNEAYNLLDLKAGYYFSANFFLYIKAANLLNETYFANPDPDIPEAKKLDISAGFNFYF